MLTFYFQSTQKNASDAENIGLITAAIKQNVLPLHPSLPLSPYLPSIDPSSTCKPQSLVGSRSDLLVVSDSDIYDNR